MRAGLLFVGLLAGGVTALPQAASLTSESPLPAETKSDIVQPENGAIEDDEDEDDDADAEYDYDVDASELPFETLEEAQDSWEKSRAIDFLSDYLDDHGFEGWANDLLTNTVRGGVLGTTFDCENMDDTDSCGLPKSRPCSTYEPSQTYFIHQSVGNYVSLLHTLASTLNRDELDALADKVDHIESAFDVTELESMYPFLIGAFVLGSIVAGPLAAPMTAIVGVLNVLADVDAQEGGTTDTFGGVLLVTYSTARESLVITADAVTSGNFDGIDDADDTKQFILDVFGDGQLMVLDETHILAKTYMDSFHKLLNHILIFKCLESNDWVITIPNEDGERCVTLSISYVEFPDLDSTFSSETVEYLDEGKRDAIEEYEMDLQEVIQNVLDCNGGDFDYSNASNTDWDGSYSPCALSMKTEGVPEEPIESGSQSCTAESKGAYLFYSIEISVDYNSDACNAIYDDFEANDWPSPTNWQCEDEDGHFRLWFDYGRIHEGPENVINDRINTVFPPEGREYGNVDKFNCPNW